MFSFFNRRANISIDVRRINKLLGHIELIDIREPDEYREGHIPTAINIPMDTLLSTPDKFLDRESDYYLVCRSGSRSAMTSNTLLNLGYRVIDVAGGTIGYTGSLER